MKNIISRAFFTVAVLRGLYIKFNFSLYAYDEVIILALLGILAHFAFEHGAKDSV